jgi:hypothetical protein
MAEYEVVVWKPVMRKWSRIGGPGPRDAMTPIWKAAREMALKQHPKDDPQVWIRQVEE